MKIHTPIFILGLLVFITPILGLPQMYEQIILGANGIAIMLLISNINTFNNFLKKDKKEIESVFNFEKEVKVNDKEETKL